MRAADHLDRLAVALVDVGWCSRPRYEDGPVRLLVWDSGLPGIGETIFVNDAGPGGDGGPWFQTGTGELLAPCADVPLAAEKVSRSIQVWEAGARKRVRRPSRIRRLVRVGRLMRRWR